MSFIKNSLIKIFINRQYAKEDIHLGNGATIKGNTYYEKYKNGNFYKFKLAEEWKIESAGAVLNKDSYVFFFGDGNIKEMVLAKDWEIPNTNIVIKEKTKTEFNKIGLLKKFTLAEQFMSFKSGSIVQFNRKGIVVKVTVPG